MATATSFDSLKKDLRDILRDIEVGKIQLPDFQREWIWNDDHIRSLLASVSRSFPIGAVMMLETGNPSVRFQPRLVEGLALPTSPEPETLILDGQQRLTSLFQALLMGQPVVTRDARRKQIKRWYYIHIETALDPEADRDDAIIGFPEDRKIRNFRGDVQFDCSTPELEREQGYFPCRLMLDTTGMMQWQTQFVSRDPSRIEQHLSTWTRFYQEVIERFQSYALPVISLGKSTPKEAVCLVFEKVNTGGVALTVFELLTATYAADNYLLRDDWRSRRQRLVNLPLLEGIESDEFLQAVCLLASWHRRTTAIKAGRDPERAPGITCKRKDILELSLDEYEMWAELATVGFERAARFIRTQNVLTSRDIPYRTQLTPLAAILAILEDRANQDGIRQSLAKWYWCGVLGELYGGSIETRFARDVADVPTWLDGGIEPKTVTDASFTPQRLHTLRSRNSAAYKGLFALTLQNGCQDFRSGERIDVTTFFDENVDVHHIFPKTWCAGRIDAQRAESIVNKTAISSKTNRIIGGNPPSAYLDKLQTTAGIVETRMDEILASHLIDPFALRIDDFDSFFSDRTDQLLKRIEIAMGKAVVRDVELSSGGDMVEPG